MTDLERLQAQRRADLVETFAALEPRLYDQFRFRMKTDCGTVCCVAGAYAEKHDGEIGEHIWRKHFAMSDQDCEVLFSGNSCPWPPDATAEERHRLKLKQVREIVAKYPRLED
jgi:hypothetical protein